MIETYLLAVIRGERRAWIDKIVLALLSFLESIYRGIMAIRTALYANGMIAKTKLNIPVISLGNLAAGGTGKTPLTIFLAQWLTNQGFRPAVLIRGYKGQGDGARVVSDGVNILVSTEDSGDEAQLLSRCLPGVPVVAGKDRIEGGRLAEGLGANLLLLDDGLQYLKLQRDLDIVLLDAKNPWENGHMLPRGLLREGKSGLRRAGLVVLSGPDVVDAVTLEKNVDEIRRWNENVPVIRTGIQPDFIQNFPDWWNGCSARVEPGVFLKGKTVGMMTAIGRPDKFAFTLKALGAQILFDIIRPDHHPWNIRELEELIDEDSYPQDMPIVTTEKDAVKLRFLIDSPLAERFFVLGIRTLIPSDDQSHVESAFKELNL